MDDRRVLCNEKLKEPIATALSTQGGSVAEKWGGFRSLDWIVLGGHWVLLRSHDQQRPPIQES